PDALPISERLVDQPDHTGGHRRGHRRAGPQVPCAEPVASEVDARGVQRTATEGELGRRVDVRFGSAQDGRPLARETRGLSVRPGAMDARAEYTEVAVSLAAIEAEDGPVVHVRPAADRNHARRGVRRGRGRVSGTVIARGK